MQNELCIAAEKLASGDFTCVFYKDGTFLTSERRGVAFLLELLDTRADMKDAFVADKVVGRGAAFLYVLLGVKAVYALVMSVSAKEVLTQNGIEAFCDTAPSRIMNRTKTGFCPVESAVQDITDPQAALPAIRHRLEELRNG